MPIRDCCPAARAGVTGVRRTSLPATEPPGRWPSGMTNGHTTGPSRAGSAAAWNADRPDQPQLSVGATAPAPLPTRTAILGVTGGSTPDRRGRIRAADQFFSVATSRGFAGTRNVARADPAIVRGAGAAQHYGWNPLDRPQTPKTSYRCPCPIISDGAALLAKDPSFLSRWSPDSPPPILPPRRMK
jgi:hypothetical protein